MKFESQDITRQENREILNPFPLARELFEFAQQNLDAMSYSVYVDPVYRKEGQKAIELPQVFAPLVADYPGKYLVVSCENRMSSYYADGTRMREVVLSSSQYRYESDDKLREINIREPAPGQGKGNVIFLTVSDLVNEKSYLDLNTAKGQQVSQPHGSAKVTYELDSNGNKRVSESHFSRLDESLFKWRGEQKPVRWLRDLDIENVTAEDSKITYKDLYLIGRDERGDTEEQAEVRTHIESKENAIKSIVIEIGLGAFGSGEIIYESADQSIKVVVHSPEDMRVYRNQMEIIKQDPNYAFLFEASVDQAKVLEFVKSRIEMLRNDWDKKQAVFGTPEIENTSQKLIS